MDQEVFRRRLRIAREVAGLDQAELALRLHEEGWIKSSGREQISYLENGKRTLTPKVLEGIAEICGVPRRYLIDEDCDPIRSAVELEQGEAQAGPAGSGSAGPRGMSDNPQGLSPLEQLRDAVPDVVAPRKKRA